MSALLSTTKSSAIALIRRARQRPWTVNMMALAKTILAFLLSWRTLFFLLALTNLKSVPLSWHFRLFRNMARKGAFPHTIRKRLREAARALPPPSSLSSTTPKPVHPLFRPVALHTHAPMAECDYNLHKSNSTYFSDLDLSRGSLMAQLIGPALRLNALVPHGIRKGFCYPILGSVHTSFLREIKPYERYDVRSRVLGWDRKWIVIGSWFVRKATRAELKKDRGVGGKNILKGPVGKEEVVFACVLNKYVVKAGRFTVPPELCFAASGWFPVRPEATATIRAYNSNNNSSSETKPPTTATKLENNHDVKQIVNDSATATGDVTPALGPGKVVDDAANAVHSVALEAGRRLSVNGLNRNNNDPTKLSSLSQRHDSKTRDDNDDDEEMPGWSWSEIEAERERGMHIADQWLNLDVHLRREYEIDMDMRIFC